jgi:hypothetical protein
VLRLLLHLAACLLGIEVFHFVCNASDHAAAPPSVAKNFRRPMWLAM